MRVLICGGRNFGHLNRLPDGNPNREDAKAREYRFALDWLVTEFSDYLMDPEGPPNKYGQLLIIHGNAFGADRIAKDFAAVEWLEEEPYPADWGTHGKKAGILRNIQMLEEGKPDLVVAFPGGRGTAHMVRIAKKAGVPVREITYATEPLEEGTQR